MGCSGIAHASFALSDCFLGQWHEEAFKIAIRLDYCSGTAGVKLESWGKVMSVQTAVTVACFIRAPLMISLW